MLDDFFTILFFPGTLSNKFPTREHWIQRITFAVELRWTHTQRDSVTDDAERHTTYSELFFVRLSVYATEHDSNFFQRLFIARCK